MGLVQLKYVLSKINDVEIIGSYTDPQKALNHIKEAKPELVIVDISMPQKSGLEVAKEIADMNIDTNVIFSTAFCEYALKAFEVGAVDYIVKPVSEKRMNQTINRLKKRLAARQNSQPPILEFANFKVDTENHIILKDGKEIYLLPLEYEILLYMLKNPNRVLKYQEIFENVWNACGFGDYRTVMVHISNLRKKIEDDPNNPRYIKTIRKMGYSFNLSK
ncbi:MAG: response regulator transcription factor [Clostridia bacterium]|nr:response regulator transcription factor [Clostridia bacterium]